MKRGTIVLTPFPFSNLRGRKVRPAVILSPSDRRGDDVILAFISSVLSDGRLQETDVPLRRSDSYFLSTGLKVDSVFKMDKLVTVDSQILLGELGTVPSGLMRMLDEKLKIALGLS